MSYTEGVCDTSTPPTSTSGNIVWGVGVSTGGGSSSGTAPASSSIKGSKCFPTPPRNETDCEECARAQRESLSNQFVETGSSVDLVHREYTRDETDIAVKIPGGMIDIQRRFYGNQWHFEHARTNLKFEMDSLGSYIRTIDKGGVEYEATSEEATTYTHESYKITRTENGYKWEDKRGTWKEYDEDGRMTSYGTRAGVLATLEYETSGDENLTGIFDKNSSQVLWFEYGTGSQISAVQDSEGRRIEYGYTNGLLTSVTDLLNNITEYQYDSSNRIKKVIYPNGRESNITYDDYNNVASVLDENGIGHEFEFDYDEGTKESYAMIRTTSGMVKEVWYDNEYETNKVNINGRTIMQILKDGRDIIVIDEKENETRKEFDEWDNLTRIVYPDGSIVSYEYEHTFNRRIKETNELGTITEFVYDATGNLTSKTEAAGTDLERISEYTYDTDGNQLTVKVLATSNTLEALTTMAYDEAGNMTSITDPE